jgi:hypothetical protein
VITTINTQLPFAYAQIVSLCVNFYLICLATWLGFLFSGGFPTTAYIAQDANGASEPCKPSSPFVVLYFCARAAL